MMVYKEHEVQIEILEQVIEKLNELAELGEQIEDELLRREILAHAQGRARQLRAGLRG